jgi:hypothetical protein
MSHTFQNILISIGIIVVSSLSLLFTLFCILPLSVFRAFRSEENLSLTATSVEEAREFFGRHDERKMVLIVGASTMVGFELLKLYAVEREARIIAVSSGSGEFFILFFRKKIHLIVSRSPEIASKGERFGRYGKGHVQV